MLYDVPAPAKINLFLHVLGRRADGYHLLQTAFRFIGLSDTLHFDARQDGGIGRATELAGVSAADDLTLRAAHALKQATGTSAGVQITLEKRIPTGGGLGGGSSDAASVLIALNRLWNTGLSRGELMRLGLALGADVPVFIFGQSAWGEGVGEDLTAIALPEAGYVIAQPDTSVPTPTIFAHPGLTRNTKSLKIPGLVPLGALNASDRNVGGFRGQGFKNDLEPVVFDLYPEVGIARDWLHRQLNSQLRKQQPNGVGAQVRDVQVRMSGSGACLFAEYNDFESAVLAVQEIVATMRVSDGLYIAQDVKLTDDRSGSKAAADEATADSAGADKADGSKGQGRFRLLQASTGLTEHPLRHWIAD
jgi:4-diphosphocytidyl-2-C-methyl-D-erythritol kinase